MRLEMSKKNTVPTESPPLDRWRVDELLEPARPIWGLPAIAKVIGLSVNKTRNLAKKPEVPIHLPPGCKQYFAYRSDLVAWLKASKSSSAGTNLDG